MPRRRPAAPIAAAAASIAAGPQTAPAAPAVHVERFSRPYVVVGCKIDIAGLELQLCREERRMEDTQTGAREVRVFAKDGAKYWVNGTAYPRGTPPPGFPEKPDMREGYALTRDIPTEFWRAWVQQNAKTHFVTTGMIVAFDDDASVRDFAREHRDIQSGLQPVMPDNDKRIPRPLNAAVSRPVTETSRVASVSRITQGA